MTGIAISYRRDDTAWIAGRILDRLKNHYENVEVQRENNRPAVFMDYDSIPVGVDFRNYIRSMLDSCDILLVIIGPRWMGDDGTGRTRINQDSDWVRIEVESALKKNVPVVPVLVDRTPMPTIEALPAGLHDLVYRQAAVIDTQIDFNWHIERLIREIDHLLGIPTPNKLDRNPKSAEVISRTYVDRGGEEREKEDSQPIAPKFIVRHGWRGMRILTVALLLFAAIFLSTWFFSPSPKQAATDQVYRTYNSAELGVTFAFPSNILSLDNTERKQLKLALRDGNGQEVVTISRTPLPDHKDIKRGRQDEIDELKKMNYTVTYFAPEKPQNWKDWYVLSGLKHGTEFYIRRWYTSDSVVAIEFSYPKTLAALFDKLIPTMTKQFVFSSATPKLEH